MAKGFRPVDRDQSFLLPPDMRDWLPASHRVWFVLDTVAALDTTALLSRPRQPPRATATGVAALPGIGPTAASTTGTTAGTTDSAAAGPAAAGGVVGPPAGRVGRSAAGREGYHPVMLLGVLTYAYLVGTLSSRAIERACHTDVAFRVACAQDIPDHTTIARFRQDHQDALAGLFEQVLLLCVKAGMGKFGTIAIDGTKIAANASMGANRKRSWLRKQVLEMLDTAAGVDAAEDAAEAAARADRAAAGGPPDAGWSDPDRRKQLIREALAEVNAKEDAADEHARAPRVEKAETQLRKAADRVVQVREELTAKAADFDAREAAQLAAGKTWRWTRVPVEAHCALRHALAQLTARQERLELARQATRTNKNPDPVGNITDPQSRKIRGPHGYLQGYNAQLAVTGDGLIVAAHLAQTSPDTELFVPMMNAAVAAVAVIREATGRDDAVIGTVLADAGYASNTNITANGPDRLIAIGNTRDIDRDAQTAANTANTATTKKPTPVGDMAIKVAANQDTYQRRGATVEPVNAHLKDRRNLRRFSRRGLAAANSELQIAAWVTNLAKLFNYLQPQPT